MDANGECFSNVNQIFNRYYFYKLTCFVTLLCPVTRRDQRTQKEGCDLIKISFMVCRVDFSIYEDTDRDHDSMKIFLYENNSVGCFTYIDKL